MKTNRKRPSTTSSTESPNTSSQDVEFANVPDPLPTEDVDEFSGKSNRELLIELIRGTRQLTEKVDRVIKRQKLDDARMKRIEGTISEHFSDDTDSLSWPIADISALYDLEEQLEHQKPEIHRALRNRYKKGHKKGVTNAFQFIHSNLRGLLGSSGKWSWTGRLPGYIPGQASGSSTSAEDNNSALPDPNDAIGTPEWMVEKSNPANQLLSVQALRDVCHDIFGITDAEIVKYMQHSLANINAAYRKRLQRSRQQYV